MLRLQRGKYGTVVEARYLEPFLKATPTEYDYLINYIGSLVHYVVKSDYHPNLYINKRTHILT